MSGMELAVLAATIAIASLSSAVGGVLYEVVRVMVDTTRRRNFIATVHEKGIGGTLHQLIH